MGLGSCRSRQLEVEEVRPLSKVSVGVRVVLADNRECCFLPLPRPDLDPHGVSALAPGTLSPMTARLAPRRCHDRGRLAVEFLQAQARERTAGSIGRRDLHQAAFVEEKNDGSQNPPFDRRTRLGQPDRRCVTWCGSIVPSWGQAVN